MCECETYLTDELNVRRRPAERFWKNIKIKRLDNVPAGKEENRKGKLFSFAEVNVKVHRFLPKDIKQTTGSGNQ